MAIRTQIRLPQITGSLDDSGSASSSLTAGSLQDVLNAVASGIVRITGGSNFHSAKAGSFTHSLMEITGSKLAFDSTSANATIVTNHANNALKLQSQDGNSIHLESATYANAGLKVKPASGGNTTLSVLENNADLIFGTFSGGNPLEVFRIDGDANSNAGALLMASSKEIHFGNSGEKIVGDGTNLSIDSSNDLNVTVVNNLVIDAQGTGANDGVEITLGDDGGDTNFRIQNDTGDTKFTVSSNGNVTIAGDLDVNGTTTTIDTTNLTIQDSIIGLGISGSSFGNLGDRGIVFAKGSNAYDALPSLFFTGTTDDNVFHLGKSATSPASASFSAIGQGNFSTLRLGKTEFSSAADYIGIDSGTGNLTIESSAALVLSSSSDDIIFKDGTQELLTLDSGFAHNLVGSLTINGNGSNPGSLILNDADDTQQVTIKAPGNITGDYSLLLPGAAGTSGQVLTISGVSGNDVTLGFSDQGGASNSVKTFATVAATISSNNNLSSDDGYSTTDYSSISTANAANAIDVYVNGQLMQSGSGPYATDVSDGGFTSGDYLADTLNMSTLDVKFAFDLEIDDVVCIIGRA